MDRLIQQYRETKRQLEEQRKSIQSPDPEKIALNPEQKSEKELIGGMISDLQYAIDWMTTGKKPGARRGIERRAVYQREYSMDPMDIQKYVRSTADEYEWTDIEEENVIAEWDKTRIDDALSVLTEKEREIFLMVKGYMLTQEDAAKMLGVSRSRVQIAIKRCEKKIAGHVATSLFSYSWVG